MSFAADKLLKRTSGMDMKVSTVNIYLTLVNYIHGVTLIVRYLSY